MRVDNSQSRAQAQAVKAQQAQRKPQAAQAKPEQAAKPPPAPNKAHRVDVRA